MASDGRRAQRRGDDRLPASGAWRPGDHPGRRRFLRLAEERPFALEGGGALRSIDVAYETWGSLDADGGNAVLVCHALTGDSHAAGRLEPGHVTAGWWNGLIGPGKPLDTDRLFVVCANVLGGCQGTTGPASDHPGDGRPYGSRFPVVSIRDVVRTQAGLADHLGVAAWRSVVGGSMGGMQALEWGVMFPHRVRSLAAICTTPAASAEQIAWSAMGRQAVMLDPAWNGGDYYDAGPGGGPHRGLALARQVAQVTYRSEEVYGERFGRALVDPLDGFRLDQRFQVEGYLDYHGAKLARRFDANSYLIVNKMMDLHDLGRDRGGLESALRRIEVPVLNVSVSSDRLYPPHLQRLTHEVLASIGHRTEHHLIDSPQGHDGFLLETDRLGPLVTEFLARVEKDDA
jgi:homoserine O-acetyltransferase/O-succinyltransferase